jgi:hypothetical protein
MISGRDALATIEQTIAKARSNEGQLDAALRSAEEEAARLRADRSAAFRQLARIRLDAFVQEGPEQPALIQQLDNAERRALDLVKDRSFELKQQAVTRKSLFDVVQTTEAERHKRAEVLEQALAGLEGVRRAAEPKIRASAAWKAQQAKIAAAETIADESDKKAKQAEDDRITKGKPYEEDPLFMYLWKAKFGTAEYEARFLTKFFDRMIARKVGYPDARANYSMLNEIPLRLREHAERRKLAIETERQGLAQAESAALSEVGAGDLVAKVEKARQALIEVERDLSGKKRKLEEFETETAAAAEDPAYEQAISILAEADSREDVRELYADASCTRTKDDDKAVRQIEGIEQKLAKAEGQIDQIRAEARDLARRRADIERERDNFRNRGYDNPYGGFKNEGMLGSILGGLLQGAVQGAILRDALKDGYRQRDNPWGGGNSSGSVFGPWTAPNNSPTPPSSGGQWVPPWLDGGSSGGGGGGSWGGGGDSGGSGGGGGDGFSTGGGV